MENKTQTALALVQYNTAVVVTFGYRMERLRCDKGKENIIYEYGEACFNLGTSEELAAVATSQQIGVSEWDGRNLTAIARSLLKDGGFNKSL